MQSEAIDLTGNKTGEELRTRPGWERVIKPSIPAHLVGFDWQGPQQAEIKVRALKGGNWTEWLEANSSSEGPDLDSPEYNGRNGTDPVWFGPGVREVQVRVEEGELPDFKLHAVRSERSRTRFSANSASASPPNPGIVPRSAWGADESWRDCTPTIADSVRYSIVHHTATSNDYTFDDVPAILRGIYHYHRFTRQFCDIGYNLLVDRFGQRWEGRFGGVDKAVQGAHASGFNHRSTGISVIGTFTGSYLPGSAYSGLRQLLAWKLGLHGVSANSTVQVTAGAGSKFPEGQVVTLWTISGHKDVDATACPGLIQDQLPQLRNDVQYDIEEAAWEELGGFITSGPDVASWSPGRLDVFASGGDGALWHKYWTQYGLWSGWASLGGGMTLPPAAVSWGPNRIDAFVLGGDRAMWHRAWTGTEWTGWERLGGLFRSGPDAASWEPGRLDVFGVGDDGAIWRNAWIGNHWTGWGSLGGYFTADPAAVSWSPAVKNVSSGVSTPMQRIDVFGRGGDYALWYNRWEGDRWTGWQPLGGSISSAPDASSTDRGKVEVFARGDDGRVWWRSLQGETWGGWAPIYGFTNSDPGAVSWGPARIDLFSRSKDWSLRHRWWVDGNWNN